MQLREPEDRHRHRAHAACVRLTSNPLSPTPESRVKQEGSLVTLKAEETQALHILDGLPGRGDGYAVFAMVSQN